MAKVKNTYETIFVVSTRLGQEGAQALTQKFKDLIAKHATVDLIDDWGKRRLAYPIQKEIEGYYTLIYFISESDFISELERRYKITDGILRSLILKRELRRKPKKASNTKKVKAAPAAPVAEKESG